MLVVIELVIREEVDLPSIPIRIVRPYFVLPGITAGGVGLIESGEAGRLEALLRRIDVGRARDLEAEVTESADPGRDVVLVQRKLQ